MIVAYCLENGALKPIAVPAGGKLPPSAIWIDIETPTPLEDDTIEAVLGVEVPTREEMSALEQSSRLYDENGSRYVTAALLCATDTETPRVVDVTFILAGKHLITVRYDTPRAFPTVAGRLTHACPAGITGESILVSILEAVVDRTADMLEHIGTAVDHISRRVFDRKQEGENANQRYREILSATGRKEELVSSARESLASMQRVVSFLGTETEEIKVSVELKTSLKSMSRDITGLSDYAAFIGDKLQFILDATIGMVGLEQNNIIKIFAVLSVVFMPPTLIASIYGMNFQHMPELTLTYAYPVALLAMVVSAILPYVFFKWRGWL